MLKELIPDSWKFYLNEEVDKEYFSQLENKLENAYKDEKIIHPHKKLIFKALDVCPPEKVKVIILGQDPYHGQGQAMGLSFSVPRGIKIPPSLRNIFKEQMADLKIEYPDHGDLTAWAKQGVLLLNSILTVEHKLAGSHAKWGWENFTDKLIEIMSETFQHLVFLLWGNYAKKKKTLINGNHLILEAGHPSPLSIKHFIGCNHFSQANEYLIKHDKKAINWKLN